MTSTITAGITTLNGDPDAIRASGRRWRTAAMACAAAAAQVGAVAVVDGFLGDESDTWEQRLQPETSTLLSTLATARDIIGGALVTYAGTLEDCQQELRGLTVHRAEASSALDRWRATPTAEPDLVDSATQTVHDLNARSAAVLARHDAAVRACSIQIDRATAMAPGRVTGVRPGVTAVRAGGGPGRFRQSSNAVMAGFRLTEPAQLSAVGPFLATDNPRDADEGTDQPSPQSWIDPATRERYFQALYQYCLGKNTISTDDLTGEGSGLDAGCVGYADSALYSPEALVEAVTLSKGVIAMPPLPKTTFADVWNDYVDALRDMGTMAEQAGDTFIKVMFSGCMEGGSFGACLFDIASAPIPFVKGAKAVKVGVELVEDGADVVKAGNKAAEAEKAAADAAKVRAKPDEPAAVAARDLSENGAPLPPRAQPPMTPEAARAWNEQLMEELAPGGARIGTGGTDKDIRRLPGGVPAAQNMFSKLAARGRVVENSSERTRVELPGGGIVQYRTKMTNSGDVPVTIDVRIPGFKLVKRLKYLP